MKSSSSTKFKWLPLSRGPTLEPGQQQDQRDILSTRTWRQLAHSPSSNMPVQENFSFRTVKVRVTAIATVTTTHATGSICHLDWGQLQLLTCHRKVVTKKRSTNTHAHYKVMFQFTNPNRSMKEITVDGSIIEIHFSYLHHNQTSS
jgi:hypothetical protein